MIRKICFVGAISAAFAGALTFSTGAQQSATPAPPASAPRRPFVPGQVRPEENPEAVSRGKANYEVNCRACHGPDLRGGDMGGPNLLRSPIAMTDQHGENIVPIIHGARQAQGMPAIPLSDDQANDVAAYIRSVISTIGGQGMPPGELKPLNIVVGDAARGKAFFVAHCESCHSVTGDFKGLANKFSDPKQLQGIWVAGGRAIDRQRANYKPTATVSTAPGKSVSGDLVQIDDFLVTLRLTDGTLQSFRRDGNKPSVKVNDPVEAHTRLLPKYTDDDVHNVTAYLVTLK